MGVVNAKKEEFAKAIKNLTDMTQQLVVAYAQQARFIERLAQREGAEAKSNGANRASARVNPLTWCAASARRATQ
jgi:hypothetical protein